MIRIFRFFCCLTVLTALSPEKGQVQTPPGSRTETPSVPLYTEEEPAPAFDGDLNSWLIKHLPLFVTDSEAVLDLQTGIEFTVHEDGALSRFEIVRTSWNGRFDEKILQMMRKMPPWRPVTVQGRPVSMRHRVQVPSRVIFANPEGPPEFDGDISSWLHKQVRYSVPDSEEVYSLRVVVRFIVNETGTLSNFHVLRPSGDPRFDTVVLRALPAMPPWKPGTQAGRPVPSYFVLPVSIHWD